MHDPFDEIDFEQYVDRCESVAEWSLSNIFRNWEAYPASPDLANLPEMDLQKWTNRLGLVDKFHQSSDFARRTLLAEFQRLTQPYDGTTTDGLGALFDNATNRKRHERELSHLIKLKERGPHLDRDYFNDVRLNFLAACDGTDAGQRERFKKLGDLLDKYEMWTKPEELEVVFACLEEAARPSHREKGRTKDDADRLKSAKIFILDSIERGLSPTLKDSIDHALARNPDAFCTVERSRARIGPKLRTKMAWRGIAWSRQGRIVKKDA